MTIKEICEALRELGVREVILDDKGPTVEFAGRDFRIVATNADFAENDL